MPLHHDKNSMPLDLTSMALDRSLMPLDSTLHLALSPREHCNFIVASISHIQGDT